MTKNEIQNAISELRMYNGRLRPKYLRNLRLYTYSMNVSLDQVKEGNVVGYWVLMDGSNYTSGINENVIQSCIDSLTSQLCSKHARPYFTTVNGTYNQQQVAKQAQQYFDFMYDEQNVNITVTDAFRDACIFGTGIVYIDPIRKEIKRALPWQVYWRPAEDTYDNITRIYYERKSYPTNSIVGYTGKEDYVTYGEYYDVVNHIRATVINGKITVYPFNSPKLPFSFLHYVNPVCGRDTSSVVDLIYGIQMKIDEMYSTMSEAIKKNPAQTFVVPQGSDIKVTTLSNRVGQILTYKPIEGVTNPVTSVTPNFIADQYIQVVNMLKEDAYKLVGISELSSQSKKPSGLDSGKALQTINDIESERFEVQYKQVINCYVDIAKKCILCFDPTDEILPADRNRLNIKWSDVVDNYGKMKIQFSAMDFLSKDPSTRAQEIDMLVNRGVISPSRVAQFYDMPDSDACYNYANNSINAVLAVINQAIVNEDYTIPNYIPIDLLKSEVISTMQSLKAVENDENARDIGRLQTLYQEIVNKQNQINTMMQQNIEQNNRTAFAQQLEQQKAVGEVDIALEVEKQTALQQAQITNIV